MNELLMVCERIAPELMTVLKDRYKLLSHLAYEEPLGRRSLAAATDISERAVRSHVDALRGNGLVEISKPGIYLSAEGRDLVPKLRGILHEYERVGELEQQLKHALHIDDVIITPSEGSLMLKRLGFTAAKVVQRMVTDGSVVAVSGGSTMAAMADEMPSSVLHPIVVPARGGVGEVVEYQANVIASVLAERWHGSYKILHLPDGLSKDSLDMLVTLEPQIKEISEVIHRTDILVFGIGQALHMADVRHIPDGVRQQLVDGNAVGEALGQYCSMDGSIVYATNNIGLSLRDIVNIPHVIAVAGGFDKASAIISVMRSCKKGILIIDDQAAEGMRQLLDIPAL